MSHTPLPPAPRKVHFWCTFFALPAMNGPLPAELKFRENTALATITAFYCLVGIATMNVEHISQHKDILSPIIQYTGSCCIIAMAGTSKWLVSLRVLAHSIGSLLLPHITPTPKPSVWLLHASLATSTIATHLVLSDPWCPKLFELPLGPNFVDYLHVVLAVIFYTQS